MKEPDLDSAVVALRLYVLAAIVVLLAVWWSWRGALTVGVLTIGALAAHGIRVMRRDAQGGSLAELIARERARQDQTRKDSMI